MTIESTLTDEQLRAEVRAWLDANWDAALKRAQDDQAASGKAWLGKVFEARWAVPRWPVAWYGRGLGNDQAKIIEQEFARVAALGTGQDRSNLAANTLLTFGQEALKRELLPKLLTNTASICLLYSEPGAGSDLAGLRTRAEREGDRWIITGQKVWTSGAMTADYGLLIARTNWDVPKHQGISFFFVPMKQSGITVRPIHQITGDSHFNEVFLDRAVAPQDHLLGDENAGWKVLQTALAYERLIMGEGAGERRQGSMRDNRANLIQLAREAGRLDDPLIRQDIARAMAYRQLNALNMARAKTALEQSTSASIMSLGKLAMSRILHEDARVMTAILGAQSLLDGPEHPTAADVNYRCFNAYMTSIGGGTDQIQRNIIGERVLGLPREPEFDRDLPFRQSRAVTG
ncbi:MAG: acyl-CoA dehydrogenase family protein [Steroidobacteraceae bacterium]